jgi:hypothetical protein
MIDYDKPDDDPIVAEVRRAREELAAGFNYDLRAICEEMQRRQETTGRKYASLAQKQPQPISDAPTKKAG